MRTEKILGETRVAFKQGARLLATDGTKGPSYGTLQRWAKEGLKSKSNPNGPLVSLEFYYIGGRLYTSVEAFRRWLAKIN